MTDAYGIFVRKDTCDCCGERDVDLYVDIDQYMPEEFEGVGCLNCISSFAETADDRDEDLLDADFDMW